MQAILKIWMLSVRGASLALLAAGMVLPIAQAQSANPNQKRGNKASDSTQALSPSESSKAAEKESAPANKEHVGGPQEGIKVHGHWVIDVRNPDGKLVTHREFENAYYGDTFLARTLARQNSVGLWSIILYNPDNVANSIREPNDPAESASKNLTISISGKAFVLKGSFTPQVDLSINIVQTYVQYELFTHATPTPVSVVSGQTVQVTVTFTFS